MKTPTKIELPEGELSVKFSPARSSWLMYCGGENLPLVCGGYPTEAIKELLAWYAVPIGTAVTIFGGSSMGKQVVLTTRETPEPPESPCALFVQSRCPHGNEWRECGACGESESQREAAGLADEKPDGQAENASVDLPDTAAQDSASKSNNPAVSG